MDHPGLKKIDAESIRKFLFQNYTYCQEILEQAKQLSVQGLATFESIRPVEHKSCIDVEYMEPVRSLDRIENVHNYQVLDEDQLSGFLKTISNECKEFVQTEARDQMV